MNSNDKIIMRLAHQDDYASLQSIRHQAFTPIFESFRNILGDVIYELAQRQEDEAQEAMLTAMFEPESEWMLYVAELNGKVAGFVSIHLNAETTVGEIGLNAVKPQYSGHGIGTKMYEFAITRMQEAGMRVATVATGGDESHAPARRAYEKAGFDVQIPSVWMCRQL